eukprot:scaffold32301_cov135-Isochrysis_galbana.AAC.12
MLIQCCVWGSKGPCAGSQGPAQDPAEHPRHSSHCLILRLRFARSKSKRSLPSSIAICAASPAGTLRAEHKPRTVCAPCQLLPGPGGVSSSAAD